jgi:hypothetical protein
MESKGKSGATDGVGQKKLCLFFAPSGHTVIAKGVPRHPGKAFHKKPSAPQRGRTEVFPQTKFRASIQGAMQAGAGFPG